MSTLLKFPKGRLVAIDVDTTGVDKKKAKLVAVHAVEIIDNKLTGLFFHMFINKRENNKKEYMNYFSDYDYNVKKENKKQYFLNFIKNSTIVSHNINFDVDFINNEFGINLNKDDCVCTLRILRYILKYPNIESATYFYGIKIKNKDFHNGIVDATALARMVCKMNENEDYYYNIEKFYSNLPIQNKQIINENMKKTTKNKYDNIINDENIDTVKNKIKSLKITESNEINFNEINNIKNNLNLEDKKNEEDKMNFNEIESTHYETKNTNNVIENTNHKTNENSEVNKNIINITNNCGTKNNNVKQENMDEFNLKGIKSKIKNIKDNKNKRGINIINEDKVYVTKAGKCYHLISNCGNTKYFTEVTKKQAIELKLKLCKTCEKKFYINEFK